MRDHEHRHAPGQPTGATNPPHPTPPRHRRPLSRYAILTAALAAAPAAAATQLWQAAPDTPSDWFTPASWSTGVPTSADTAFINNGGTAQIASGTAAFRSLTLGNAAVDSGTLSITGGQLSTTFSQTITVGNSGTGDISQSAGKVTLPSLGSLSLYLAFAPASSGSYSLSGTGLLAASSVYLGYGGTASFVQTGGTHSLTGGLSSLYLAYQPTSTASYSLSGTGTLAGGFSGANQYIGYGGSATFTQTGGTNAGVNSLYLGYDATATGTYSLSGTGKLVGNSYGTQYVGYGGSATFIQTGGTNTGADSLYLGYNAGATGTYSLSGTGQLTLGPSDTYVGYNGTGTFAQSGGTVTAGIGTKLYLGYNAKTTGFYTLSGGQLGANVLVGEAGTGTFTQTGGTVTGAMYLGDAPRSSGTLLLSGGQVSGLSVGGGGSGTVVQTGGTVTAATLSIAGGYQSTGSYSLSGTTASIRSTYMEMDKNGQSASFVQNGGSVSLTQSLSITPNSLYSSTATGCYTLNAGSLTAGSISIGGHGLRHLRPIRRHRQPRARHAQHDPKYRPRFLLVLPPLRRFAHLRHPIHRRHLHPIRRRQYHRQRHL